MKIFKLSLATYFSQTMRQELPEDHTNAIKLFLHREQDLIFKYCHTMKRRVMFGWDLLQCKDLAETVPKEMIQAAYEKHHRTLSCGSVT